MYTVRVITNISSCRVNTTSMQQIKQLGISFGSIFLLFSGESSWGHVHSSWGRGRSRGRVQGVHTPPPPEMTCSFLIQLVFMTALLTVSLTVKIPKIDELHHFIIEVIL